MESSGSLNKFGDVFDDKQNDDKSNKEIILDFQCVAGSVYKLGVQRHADNSIRDRLVL